MKRIDVLPDDVLLEIFDFYVNMSLSYRRKGPRREAWQMLVHVCRRWRSLVFGSPRRLNLRLFFTSRTPAKGTLDIWPALPLVVDGLLASSSSTDNVIAVLGQSNRVSQVSLALAGWQLENVLAAMQVPFPELTELRLNSYDNTPPVIPDSFLGGSAPSLLFFKLVRISFPGLPKLLLFATHLVHLRLSDIPHSGYISPGAMITLLSALSSLETLYLGFEYPQSRPDWQTPGLLPPKRFILPALKKVRFKGVTGYLEELVNSIDTPQLDEMYIHFFNQNQIDFDCPRLAQFINCTPALRAFDEARVRFIDGTAGVKLRHRTSESDFDDLGIDISRGEPDRQLSFVARLCNSSLPPLSTIVDLYIEHRYWLLGQNFDAIENTMWLEVLLPFTAVKNLYLCKGFAPGIAAALEELVGDRVTKILPNLQNIFVEGREQSGPFKTNIKQFLTARKVSSHPITIFCWGNNSGVERK